jgi:ferredoxin, 2Fe-2S
VAGTVHVEPAGIDLHVADGETVMRAAERLGYRWPTVCHGQAVCTTCFFELVSGGEHLTPMSRVERAALASSPVVTLAAGVVRLACQTGVTGDVSLRKRGVRPVQECS